MAWSARKKSSARRLSKGARGIRSLILTIPSKWQRPVHAPSLFIFARVFIPPCRLAAPVVYVRAHGRTSVFGARRNDTTTRTIFPLRSPPRIPESLKARITFPRRRTRQKRASRFRARHSCWSSHGPIFISSPLHLTYRTPRRPFSQSDDGLIDLSHVTKSSLFSLGRKRRRDEARRGEAKSRPPPDSRCGVRPQKFALKVYKPPQEFIVGASRVLLTKLSRS